MSFPLAAGIFLGWFAARVGLVLSVVLTICWLAGIASGHLVLIAILLTVAAAAFTLSLSLTVMARTTRGAK